MNLDVVIEGLPPNAWHRRSHGHRPYVEGPGPFAHRELRARFFARRLVGGSVWLRRLEQQRFELFQFHRLMLVEPSLTKRL